jgi:hypothetical protein
MRLLKICGLIAGCLVLAFVAYFVQWELQYRHSRSAATDFCDSVPLGSDISKTKALLDAQTALRHGMMSSGTYMVIFKGPIFNAFTCALTVADAKVTAKRVAED